MSKMRMPDDPRAYAGRGGVTTAQAQAYGPELQRIEEAAGELTPAAVVKEARKKKSPMHTFFDWDDASAGAKFRHAEAGRMIRGVILVHTPPAGGEPVSIRAFANVTTPSDEGVSRSYRNIATVLNDEEYSAQVLDYYMGRMKAFAAEGRKLKALRKDYLAPVLEAVDVAVAKHEEEKEK